MTQPQRNEERLLDYLYGELDADARAQVDAELDSNPALREQLDGHRRVRTAFAELPRPQQSAESTQRMTALLMQQAAQQAAGKGSAEPVEAGGGKLLSFRSRTLRRVFTNPATGIFAAAAAALVWVAVKSQNPTSESTPAVATNTATSPATVATVPPATPTEGVQAGEAPATGDVATKESKPAAQAAPDAPAQVWAQLSRSAATSSLAKAPQVGTRPDPTSAPEKPIALRAIRDKAKDSLDGKAMALNDGYAKNKGAMPKTELASPKADRAFDDQRREAEYPSPAATPAAPVAPAAPAPAPSAAATDSEGGVRGAIAQTQARRNQRVIEELANQELGAMPAPPGGAARPSSPPPPPPAAAAPAEAERYAQNDVADKSAVAEDEKKSSYASSSRHREQASGAGSAANMARSPAGPAQRVDNLDGDRNNLPLLTAVQEYLRQGRCAEANAALVRVEQSFPATRGLAEARAQWQKSCSAAPQQQAMPGQERQMLAQPVENQQAVPMASPAPMNRSMKKAAPARAKPTPAKAADSAVAY